MMSGGRFSVLTAVGLLPIAVAGCDIDALMAGAAKAREELRDPDLHKMTATVMPPPAASCCARDARWS